MIAIGRWALLSVVCCRPLVAQPVAAADRFDHSFRKYAKRYFGPDVDWRLFKAQAMAESGLDPGAMSKVGARGLMQLMPSTFREIQSKNPDMTAVDDAESNIAAGIAYDRALWRSWERDTVQADRHAFTFASYNAGRGTILKAQATALGARLDPRQWPNIEVVAPKVPRWRYVETIGYVKKIEGNVALLDDKGRLEVGRRKPN